MKLRKMWILFAVVAIAACGGAAEEPATGSADTAAVADETAMDDGAAIRALVGDIVLHYNMHHASMVADFYTDDAVVLGANGSVLRSREDRVASLGLLEDRADVILPAAIIYERVAVLAGVDEIVVPRVGVKEGVLVDLVEDIVGSSLHARRLLR